MKNDSATVLYIDILKRSLAQKDLDIKTLPSYAAVKSALLKNEDRLPLSVVTRIWKDAVQKTNDNALALKAGIKIHPSDYGIMAYAWLNCNNFSDILNLVCKYKTLMNDAFKATLTKNENLYIYTLYSDEAVSADLVELDFSSILYMGYIVSGDMDHSNVKIERIEFRHSAQAPLSIYKNCFKCDIDFGKTHNKMYLTKNTLSTEVVSPKSFILKFFLKLAEKISSRQTKEKQLRHKIEQYIYESISTQNPISINNASAHLNCSASTLKRSLAKEGYTFKGISDSIIEKEAKTLLKDSTLTVSDVAHMLQFSNTSSFQRAFKRWSNMSPSEYKKLIKHT